MTPSAQSMTWSGQVHEAIDTGPGTQDYSGPTHAEVAYDEYRLAWEDVIFGTLVEWARDRSFAVEMIEDGYDPPSLRTLETAIFYAMMLRDSKRPSPTRVLMDGDFGICFELEQEDELLSLRFEENTYQLDCFTGTDLTHTVEGRLD